MAEVQVEVIGFERPSGEGKTLFVRGIPRCLPREEKWASLHSAFFQYGLIFDVSLPQSPAKDGPRENSEATPPVSMETEYGFVTFYSALAAKAALASMRSTPLHIGNHTVKVELARPRAELTASRGSLNIHKCRDLSNYYLGFNLWSVRIIDMKNIEEQAGAGEGGGSVWVGVWCRVEVTVGGCEGGSCGEGQWRAEEGESTTDRVRPRGTARKMALSRACEDAFSHILLVVAPGRPASAMIVRRAKEHARQLVGDLTSTCPPVSVLPCQPHDTCLEQ